jgi:hypothetical protein
MENKAKLRENGIVLIVLGILNILTFVSTVVKSLIDGTVSAALATIEADILVAVKVGLIVLCAIMVLIAGADIFLGAKALKVSKKPNAGKGYIIVAKLFSILTCIAVIANIISMFTGNAASAVDGGVNMASYALSLCIYILFIKSAEAVRNDYINGTK